MHFILTTPISPQLKCEGPFDVIIGWIVLEHEDMVITCRLNRNQRGAPLHRGISGQVNRAALDPKPPPSPRHACRCTAVLRCTSSTPSVRVDERESLHFASAITEVKSSRPYEIGVKEQKKAYAVSRRRRRNDRNRSRKQARHWDVPQKTMSSFGTNRGTSRGEKPTPSRWFVERTRPNHRPWGDGCLGNGFRWNK
ncbi:hypothetical protein PHSY_003498 [Pseudozyma hubeiensis SY62]|uniref:Uncharacterized protein n=1 Tax=Pseudozyma hubeiensis (strain SY62) TaxID=1305764 RepID=R9PCX5_PSEHS|nr:hypothetical protein PHSY_003498 [Pseudozyma hubeiensis SY62]GAC95920.1 hypothetical protein PHSY_003498 [Pseudozyma hubeiensis SY62]